MNTSRIALITLLALLSASLASPTARATQMELPHHPAQPLGAVTCADCHSAHVNPLLFRGDAQAAKCIACHNPTGIASAKSNVGVHVVNIGPGPYDIIDCGTCHNAHYPVQTTEVRAPFNVANNLSLIRSDLDKYWPTALAPLVFQDRTKDFTHNDGAGFNGVCQSCHANVRHHTQTGTDPAHNAALDCTTCHKHEDGFLPSGGCSGCHDSAQGPNRPIMGPAGDHAGAISMHGDGVDESNCVVCHYLGDHGDGTHTLNYFNPNDPRDIIVSITDQTTQGAQLEPLCLACHDGNGTAGSPPFADGFMPPTILAADWGASSHDTAGNLTCFGDGFSTGCHGNGHAEDRPSLLADPTPTVGADTCDPPRIEEGFCYSCHELGGLASTDIQAQFNIAGGSNHTVCDDDQTTDGDGVIECLDCHNPHIATPTNKLADPDDTSSVWTGSDRDFCLKCHDGAAPAAVTFLHGGNYNGFDKTTYVGSPHDLALGTYGCRHCHDPHGTAHWANLVARYDINDFNNYNAADYALCGLCHDLNRLTNGSDSLFEDHHELHVKDNQAPCIICHDPHAPRDVGESLINHSYAVNSGNYNITMIDGRNPSTAFWYSNGGNQGNCWLRCHGHTHDSENYDRDRGPRTPTTSAACTGPCH